ncbi:MAG: PilZ domain-containing protein [Deltaproteobacteria bacterium]|nr:PilZ domain-containing protein [Deltaproteobacteria bacterium]
MRDSKRSPEVKVVGENRRGYARVDDLLRVDYRKITPEEYERYGDNPDGIFKNIFGEFPQTPEIEEVNLELLYKLIYQANLKMDRILEILESRDTDRYMSVGTEYVNISGSGMSFIATQGFSIGDTIALKLFLPLVSSTWITVMGKVKSSTSLSPKDGYRTAVHFTGLSEADREMIIRYVFKRQRELLRDTSDMED